MVYGLPSFSLYNIVDSSCNAADLLQKRMISQTDSRMALSWARQVTTGMARKIRNRS